MDLLASYVVANCVNRSQDLVSSLDVVVVPVVVGDSGASHRTLLAAGEAAVHAYLGMAMACAVEVVEEPSCQVPDTDAASPSAAVLVVRMAETDDAAAVAVVVPMASCHLVAWDC